jgi:hypothetical protein
MEEESEKTKALSYLHIGFLSGPNILGSSRSNVCVLPL